MSGYNGRRGPNVSEFIANLNTIPSAYDMAAQNDDGLNIEQDLAMFTNAEFFDFDLNEIPDIPQPMEYDPAQEERVRRQNASAYRHGNAKTGEFVNGDLQFPDFSNFPHVVPDLSATNLAAAQPNTYPLPNYASSAATSPVSPQAGPVTATKRKLDALSDPTANSHTAIEEGPRLAAEEDKRRRNTAASARFRVKKKQREQALEKAAKEMTEKVSVLESRVAQLEMENKWLKSLITEKNESKGDIAELYKKFTKENSEARSTGERTDGVGTAAKDGKA